MLLQSHTQLAPSFSFTPCVYGQGLQLNRCHGPIGWLPAGILYMPVSPLPDSPLALHARKVPHEHLGVPFSVFPHLAPLYRGDAGAGGTSCPRTAAQ